MNTRNDERVAIGCVEIHACRHNPYGTRRARESGMGKIGGGGKRISTFQIFDPLLAHASLLPSLSFSHRLANILLHLELGFRKCFRK